MTTQPRLLLGVLLFVLLAYQLITVQHALLVISSKMIFAKALALTDFILKTQLSDAKDAPTIAKLAIMLKIASRAMPRLIIGFSIQSCKDALLSMDSSIIMQLFALSALQFAQHALLQLIALFALLIIS